MRRLLELVARQEGARGAVLQPGRVLGSPPPVAAAVAAALRGEGQTSVRVHDAAARDGGGGGGDDRALRAKGTE